MADVITSTEGAYAYAVSGAEIKCSYGEMSSILEGGGGAVINEKTQLSIDCLNVQPFLTCRSPFNPEVVEATLAKAVAAGEDEAEVALRIEAAIAEGEANQAGDTGKAGSEGEAGSTWEPGDFQLEKVPCKPEITIPWLNGKADELTGGAVVMLDISANVCINCGNIIVVEDGQNEVVG